MKKWFMLIIVLTFFLGACTTPPVKSTPTTAPSATTQPSAIPTMTSLPTFTPEPTTPPEAFVVQADGTLAHWNEDKEAYETLFAAETFATDETTGWVTGMDADGQLTGVYNPETGETYVLDAGRLTSGDTAYEWDGTGWKEIVTPEQLVLLDETSQTVSWWNKNTKQYEVLEHIKPNEIVRQTLPDGREVLTGVISAVPAESATGKEPKYPVAMVDLTNGEIARGDFDNTAPNQIRYNQAVKMSDGTWYQWESGSQTWNPVTDETTQVILEAGEDPSDQYKPEKWADGTYLVKQYNGARLAKRGGDGGWEPITDLTDKYGFKYLRSVRSIDQLVFPQRDESVDQGDMHVSESSRQFRGVFVDYEAASLWFEPSLGEYVTLYTVTQLVPLTPTRWQTVKVIWGTNYPEPQINFGKIIKVAGGSTGGKIITSDPERAWRLLRPGQVVDARVWIKVAGRNLNIRNQQRQNLVTACYNDSAVLFDRLPRAVGGAGDTESLPAGLTVHADALTIPFGY